MKKIISILLILILVFSMVGCGKEDLSPEDTVREGLTAIKEMDKSSMEKHFQDFKLEEDDLMKHTKYADLFVENLEFEIISSEIDEDNATVSTEISNINFSPIMADLMNYLLEETAKSQGQISNLQEKMDKKLKELLIKHSDEINTNTIDIKLVRENNSWKIQKDLVLDEAMFRGLISTIEDFTIN